VHYFAGPSLKKETATFPDDGNVYYGDFRVRCATGSAVISHGHNLRQPWIIHLVAPYLDENGAVQVQLYMKTVASTLACIDGVRIRSVALAVFGTAYYGCPCLLAAVMTLRTVREWLEVPENSEKCDKIYICSPQGGHAPLSQLWNKAFPTP